MESLVVPRLSADQEQEEKVVVVVGVQGEEECSLRKPVQSESDETSSLAPLVTETSSFGNPALTGIYNNGQRSLGPKLCENRDPWQNVHGRKDASPGKLPSPFFAPRLHLAQNFAQNVPSEKGRRCSGGYLCLVLAVILLAFVSVGAVGYCTYLHGQLNHQAEEIQTVLNALKVMKQSQ
ncbi:hypothetical protein BaRGS_00028275, partial [Batillaria attramentaria]